MSATLSRFTKSSTTGAGKPSTPLSWPVVLGVATLGGGAVWAYRRRLSDAAEAQRSVSAGKAAIGGPFSLVRDDGAPFTDADYRGRYLLLYFGFTFCPDVCPAELRKLATVLDLLEQRGVGGDAVVVPLFISLDPNRDSVAQVRHYVAEFHPRLRGATGTPTQCADASRAFRVYASRTGDADPDADPDDYLVDHSIITYLVDRGGQFAAYYGQAKTALEIADAVEKEILRRA